jgi:hypothetical protein
VGRVVRIADKEQEAVSIGTRRLIAGLEPAEFAAALSREVGYPISAYVYLSWERDGSPPQVVIDAARRLGGGEVGAAGSAPSTMSRRHFLGGMATLTAVAMSGLDPRTAAGSSYPVGSAGDDRRMSPEGAADLEALVLDYRRSYATRRTVADLLPGVMGMTQLLIDLGKRDQWPNRKTPIASLIGQTAMLTGLLNLMGPRRLDDALAWYRLAFRAAREVQDCDLALYVLSSLAFHAASADRLVDGLALVDTARQVAPRAAPRTRAHASSLASELHARNGDDRAAGRSLEAARHAFQDTRSMPDWKGAGWFDEAKLDAYEGGNLLLLGRHNEAETLLRASLQRLDHTRVKHRCTSTADLALCLASRATVDVEEVCAHAASALALATHIGHQESVLRVARVHFRLLRWRRQPAVRELGERIDAARLVAS